MPRWIVHILWILHPPPVLCAALAKLARGFDKVRGCLNGFFIIVGLAYTDPLSK